MRKQLELSDSKSCMNRAQDNEMTFVLLGRDPAAPYAIRMWAVERVRIGKNDEHDPQITEALECARLMDVERKAEIGTTVAASSQREADSNREFVKAHLPEEV